MGRVVEERRTVDGRRLFLIYTSHLLGSVMQHVSRTSCFPEESQDTLGKRSCLAHFPPFYRATMATNFNTDRCKIEYYWSTA
jgi:hypothetical protein